MANTPQFEHASATNWVAEKARVVPSSNPIIPNQIFSEAGSGVVQVADLGDAVQLFELVIPNVSETNKDALLAFFADADVNYGLNTFTFREEDGVTTHTVRLWPIGEAIDYQKVSGGLYNLNILLREEIA